MLVILFFAGELLTDAINVLKPALAADGSMVQGTILVGTVQGDLHDIGKNIFKSMIESAGFEVIDLGIDVKPEAFVEKALELKPDVIGMSGVLTLAVDSMKNTVEALKAANIDSKLSLAEILLPVKVVNMSVLMLIQPMPPKVSVLVRAGSKTDN